MRRRGQLGDGVDALLQRSVDERFSDCAAAVQVLFATAADVQVTHLSPSKKNRVGCELILVLCQGLYDVNRFEDVVLPRLQLAVSGDLLATTPEQLITGLNMPNVRRISTYSEAAGAVLSGQLVVFVSGGAVAIDIAKHPNRKPEDSNLEVTLFGGRDGFIEDLTTNVALVRKRVNTLALCVEEYQIGRLSKTRVALLFRGDASNPASVEEVRRHLVHNDIESVESGTELVDLLNPSKYAFIQNYRLSGRPDFVVRCLREGRFALFIDAAPVAMLAPVTLTFLLRAADDMYVSFPFVVFERILRYLAFVMALFLPGFYVAITAMHPDQVPLSLLATLVNSRRGVPFSTPLEAIGMLILFEIFKESGTHLPQPAGNTLSVVGGLIIGDAAIRAGLTSPALVVVISASAVTLYAIANHALAGAVSLLRIGILIIAAAFGMYGFILSCIFVVTYLAQIRSFGTPFLFPVSPFRGVAFLRTYWSNWSTRRRRST